MSFNLIPLPSVRLVESSDLFLDGGEASLAWFQALAQCTLGLGESAQLAVLRNGGAACAALPLACRQDGTFRALTAPYTTRFGPAAGDSNNAEKLGAALGAAAARRLELDALDDSVLNLALLQGLKRGGMICATYCHFANWHEEISSFEEYWEGRPAALRHTVARKRQKADRAGARFQLASTAQEIDGLLPFYLEIYAQSGKVPEPHSGFMPAMLKALAVRDEVRLGVLSLEERPVAAQIWLVNAGQATIFKLAHRPEWSAYSPGTILTHWMFSRLLARDHIRRVDFGRGDDTYKRNWLGSRSYRWGLIACNPRNLGGLRDVATQVLPTWTGGWLRRLTSHRDSCTSKSTGAFGPRQQPAA